MGAGTCDDRLTNRRSHREHTSPYATCRCPGASWRSAGLADGGDGGCAQGAESPSRHCWRGGECLVFIERLTGFETVEELSEHVVEQMGWAWAGQSPPSRRRRSGRTLREGPSARRQFLGGRRAQPEPWASWNGLLAAAPWSFGRLPECDVSQDLGGGLWLSAGRVVPRDVALLCGEQRLQASQPDFYPCELRPVENRTSLLCKEAEYVHGCCGGPDASAAASVPSAAAEADSGL